MDLRLRSTLVDSVLDTTGSMQRLMEELDRLSLQEREQDHSRRRHKHKNGRHNEKHPHMYRSQELVESSWLPEVSNPIPTFVHEDTLSLDNLSSRSRSSVSSRFDSAIGSLPSQTDDDSIHSLSPPPHNHATFDYTGEEYLPMISYAVPEAAYKVRGLRFAETNSLTTSTTVSSYLFSNQERIEKPKKHKRAPQPDTSLAASTSSVNSMSSSPKIHPIPEAEGKDLQSGSSSSTVTGEWPSTGGELNKGPQATATALKRAPRNKRKTPKKKVATNGEIEDTPKGSPPLPRRYQVTPQLSHENTIIDVASGEARRTNAPKRSASILQRLRRRHGSFKRDRRPRRRVPVKRSFSDRITYQARKGRVYGDDDPISTPSLLRPVGRLLDIRSGNLHVVELHKPPSGRYGIYIIEGLTGGVFVSRFAEESAEKFFSGLLSPGDEIVAVNGQTTRNKSLDHVHNVLATLDYIVLTVIPVSGRPDW